MALSVPTVDTFALHQHVEHVDNDDWAEYALQQATDLMVLATGLAADPDDEMHQRIVSYGILDMAWYLYVQTENKDALYTPFSGERIGSYSYSKMQQSAMQGTATGVASFDQAVALITSLSDDTSRVWSEWERVFTEPYSAEQMQQRYPTAVQDSDGAWWIPPPDIAG